MYTIFMSRRELSDIFVSYRHLLITSWRKFTCNNTYLTCPLGTMSHLINVKVILHSSIRREILFTIFSICIIITFIWHTVNCLLIVVIYAYILPSILILQLHLFGENVSLTSSIYYNICLYWAIKHYYGLIYLSLPWHVHHTKWRKKFYNEFNFLY